MAIVRVTSLIAGTSNASSASLSVTGSLSVATIPILNVSWDPNGNQTPTVTSITDTQSGTWTAITPIFSAPSTTSSGTGVLSQIWWRTAPSNSSGSVTITISFSAAITGKVARGYGYSGIDTTIAPTYTSLIGTNASIGSFTSPTLTANDRLFFAIGSEQLVSSFTAPTSLTGWGVFNSSNTGGTGTAAISAGMTDTSAAGPTTISGAAMNVAANNVAIAFAVYSNIFPTTGTATISVTASASVNLNTNIVTYTALSTTTTTLSSYQIPAVTAPSGTNFFVSFVGASAATPGATITDSAGGTWTSISSGIVYGTNVSWAWVRTTPSTGATIQITISSNGSNQRVFFAGYLTNSNGLYSSPTATTGTTSFPTNTTPASTNAGDLYLSILGATDTIATTGLFPGTGWYLNSQIQQPTREAALITQIATTPSTTVSSSMTSANNGGIISTFNQSFVFGILIPLPTTGAASISINGSASPNLNFAETGSAALDVTATGFGVLYVATTGTGSINISPSAVVQLLQTTGNASITITAGTPDALYFPTTGLASIEFTIAQINSIYTDTSFVGIGTLTTDTLKTSYDGSSTIGSGSLTSDAIKTSLLSISSTSGTLTATSDAVKKFFATSAMAGTLVFSTDGLKIVIANSAAILTGSTSIASSRKASLDSSIIGLGILSTNTGRKTYGTTITAGILGATQVVFRYNPSVDSGAITYTAYLPYQLWLTSADANIWSVAAEAKNTWSVTLENNIWGATL